MRTTYIQWLLVAFSNTFNFILYFMKTTYIQWLLVAFSNTFNFILSLFYEDYIYPVATSSLLKHF